MDRTLNSCTFCGGSANSACKGCLLVLYCNSACQKAHWDAHKLDCKSSLAKSSWEPGWVLEGRTPAFMGGPPLRAFGTKKYLWGNVPALDIVQLARNEGEDYKQDLRLLFAASGDLRNVVKTVANLPEKYTQYVEIYINDKDLDVVARNIILLLVGLLVEEDGKAIECMIHVWYSAFIRPCDAQILKSRVLPLIEQVNEEISSESGNDILSKLWTVDRHRFRTELNKDSWQRVLSYFEAPQGVAAENAQQIRTATTLAPERVDYRDWQMLTYTSAHRLCSFKFRQDGILLPFGASRDTFTVPNFTIFQGPDWPMKDDADPLSGWSLSEIVAQNTGRASNDLYGKLYSHLYQLLASFRHSLRARSFSFNLLNIDASLLPVTLPPGTLFDRIETSNIADLAYLNTPRTLLLLGALLRPTRHATLLTLYMNAVEEAIAQQDEAHSAIEAEIRRAAAYVLGAGKDNEAAGALAMLSPYGKQPILLAASRTLCRDGDVYFNRYMKAAGFEEAQRELGFVMKEKHTIVEKWPMKLKLALPQDGAQEEFELLRASMHSGSERYVEWRSKRGV